MWPLTSLGHYCIPIDKGDRIQVESVCAVQLTGMTEKERHKTLLKLHRQFAHPPVKRLRSLLEDAGIWHKDDENCLNEINRNCEVCKQYAKSHQDQLSPCLWLLNSMRRLPLT